MRDSITTPTKREAERWAAERAMVLRTNAATGLQGAKKPWVMLCGVMRMRYRRSVVGSAGSESGWMR
ncbi:hypothetical protein ACMYR3_04625 [Ampullimonas aquatilis]|uniref:hypothetical protein n=1 Tax=Ampullimonas aquatilis TaxID=1341549 RepID=UPI003C7341FC